jgi:hypothetical protein
MRKLYLTKSPTGQPILRPTEDLVAASQSFFVNSGSNKGLRTLDYVPFVSADDLSARGFDYSKIFERSAFINFTPPANLQLYDEPLDPWTAYPWVDGTLDVNDTWLNANATLLTSGRWAGWWRVTGISRRNMTALQQAVKINTSRRVLFQQSQFMGQWAQGGGLGTFGGTYPDSRVWLEDCSVYGPGLHMANGQSAGGIAMQNFLLFGLSNSNLIGSKGAQCSSIRAGVEATDGFYVLYNRMKNIDGRIRDTSSPTGYSQSNTKDVGWRRTQAVQLAGQGTAPAGSINVRVAWNHISGEPDQQYIDDTINLSSLYGSAANPLIVEDNLVDGAYSHLRNVAYSGGGILLGDGNGERQIARRNIVLETSNYGQAISAGNYMTIEDGMILGTGLYPDGTRIDPVDPDSGAYIRAYGMAAADILPATRVIQRMLIRWGRPLSTDLARRVDFNANPSLGTFLDNIVTPAGIVTQADLQAARDFFFAKALTAGVTIGRRTTSPA